MPADVGVLARPQHHRHGIPARHGGQSALDRGVAWVRLLARFGNRIDVGRRDCAMEIPVSGRVRFMQAADQVVGAFAAFHFGRKRSFKGAPCGRRRYPLDG